MFISTNENAAESLRVEPCTPLVVSYEYGPFGEVIRPTGPMAKANPIRFSTKYQDDESDLLYYGYRYYKASTGTWLSRDPAEEEEGENLYEIAGNDTPDLIDILGLEWQVFRILQNRADAFGTCGDTIRGLANKIQIELDTPTIAPLVPRKNKR